MATLLTTELSKIQGQGTQGRLTIDLPRGPTYHKIAFRATHASTGAPISIPHSTGDVILKCNGSEKHRATFREMAMVQDLRCRLNTWHEKGPDNGTKRPAYVRSIARSFDGEYTTIPDTDNSLVANRFMWHFSQEWRNLPNSQKTTALGTRDLNNITIEIEQTQANIRWEVSALISDEQKGLSVVPLVRRYTCQGFSGMYQITDFNKEATFASLIFDTDSELSRITARVRQQDRRVDNHWFSSLLNKTNAFTQDVTSPWTTQELARSTLGSNTHNLQYFGPARSAKQAMVFDLTADPQDFFSLAYRNKEGAITNYEQDFLIRLEAPSGVNIPQFNIIQDVFDIPI